MTWITIVRALNPLEAQMARSRLEAAGFEVQVQNEGAALSMEGYALAVGGVLVQVEAGRADEARRFLELSEERS